MTHIIPAVAGEEVEANKLKPTASSIVSFILVGYPVCDTLSHGPMGNKSDIIRRRGCSRTLSHRQRRRSSSRKWGNKARSSACNSSLLYLTCIQATSLRAILHALEHIRNATKSVTPTSHVTPEVAPLKSAHLWKITPLLSS